jgi:hypothetical protein
MDLLTALTQSSVELESIFVRNLARFLTLRSQASRPMFLEYQKPEIETVSEDQTA